MLPLLIGEALPFANNERKQAWRIWVGRKCPRRVTTQTKNPPRAGSRPRYGRAVAAAGIAGA